MNLPTVPGCCEVNDGCGHSLGIALCYECLRHVCGSCSQKDESGTICLPCKLEKEVDYDVV